MGHANMRHVKTQNIYQHNMIVVHDAGKGGSYWGPRYFKLFIPNLFNTDPCYAQHKLANDSEACSRLFTETAKLLAKQDAATDGLLRNAVKNEE